MYTDINFKSKKDLKLAVAAGQQVTYYQSGPFGGNEVKNGTICVEGPHSPEPHRWYAVCIVKDGSIIKIS